MLCTFIWIKDYSRPGCIHSLNHESFSETVISHSVTHSSPEITWAAPSQHPHFRIRHQMDNRWASVWVERDYCRTLLTSHPCDIITASMLTPDILNDSVISLYIHQLKYKTKMKSHKHCRFSSGLFQEQIKDIS